MNAFASMLLLAAALIPASASSQVCVKRLEVPKYSNLARAAQWTGVVDLTVTIGAQGQVVSVDGSGSYPYLIEQAKTNVKEWIFCAPENDGITRVRLRYDYRLQGAPVYPLPTPRVTIDLGEGTILITSPPMERQQ